MFRAVAKRLYSVVSPKEPYKFRQLANGVKVVTNPLPSHFAALGVYMNAGSRFETPDVMGCLHLVDKLAYNSTENVGGADMIRQLEGLGGNYMCLSSRESIIYQASVFNNDVEKMARLLAETVVHPRITPEEVEEQKSFAHYEIEEIWKKPELILPELFHTVAYGGKTLGLPLLCPLERLPHITKDAIDTYRRRFYAPQNATVVFIGVEEDRAFETAEKYFGSWKGATSQPSTYEPARYTGGEYSIDHPQTPDGSMPELAYIHLGFEGLLVMDPDIYAVALLHTLLGGGGLFSAGGPGKGMYAKLYTEVLNKYGFIENCTAFNHPYSDSGLFGISSACLPNAAPYLVEILCQQFAQTFQKKRGILGAELSRSKNQLKLTLLMNLESKMVELEDVGRQIQPHGKKVPLADMIAKVDLLTIEDVQRVAERLFTGQASENGSGRATVVIQGDRDKFGDIDGVLRKYGLGKSTRGWW